MKPKFTVKDSFQFEDNRQWELLIGTRVECIVTWWAKDHEAVKSVPPIPSGRPAG